MAAFKLTTGLVAAFLLGSANGLGLSMKPAQTEEFKNYPTSYPYENESFIAEAPPGQDNDIGPDFPDNGGYAAKTLWYCNPFSFAPYGMPASMGYCGHSFQRYAYMKYDIPLEQLSPFNCSATNHVWRALDEPLPGRFGGKDGLGVEICNPVECCLEYDGIALPSKDWTYIEDNWNSRYVKYYCNWMTHEFYCALLFFEIAWCTVQYEQGALARAHIMPCWSTYAYFLEQCTNLVTTGAITFATLSELEPEPYLKSITAQQINSVVAIFYSVDRVCRPLSYYDPALSTIAGSSENAGVSHIMRGAPFALAVSLFTFLVTSL